MFTKEYLVEKIAPFDGEGKKRNSEMKKHFLYLVIKLMITY